MWYHTQTMFQCQLCLKGIKKQAFSRHKKGSSGAGGVWALRAPIHKRVQKPNLHVFKGKKYCTKCLRRIKGIFLAKIAPKPEAVAVQA